MNPEKPMIKEVAETVSAHQTARSEPLQQEKNPPTMDFIRSFILGVPMQVSHPENDKMNIEKMLETQLEADSNNQKNKKDPTDVITVDIPLLIRLLEYAREDAKTDMDLHNVAEQLIALSKEKDVLTMDQYELIVNDSLGGNRDYPTPAFAGDTQTESLHSLKKLAGIR